MTQARFSKAVLEWAVLFLIAISVTVSSPVSAQRQNENSKGALSDYKRLEGKWRRPDGGYILELKEMGEEGTLKAAYFNPRPINVARAELNRKDGKITIFVELQDVNYPGSKYNLQYDPESDRLQGTYFQAVEKQTFNIEFMRAK